VAVDPSFPFERTHAIAEAVERRVQDIVSGADVVAHIEPTEGQTKNN